MYRFLKQNLDKIILDREHLNMMCYPLQFTNEFKKLIYQAAGYNPHPGQAFFHFSHCMHKTLITGARWGKTEAVAGEALPYLLFPGTRGWFVGPTFELGEKEFRKLHLMIHKVLESDLPFAKEIEITHESYNLETGKMFIKTSIGSEVKVKSAVRPEGMLGEELDWVGPCEASKLGDEAMFRYLRPRLVTRDGHIFTGSTPSGYNWFADWNKDHKDDPNYLFLGPLPSVASPFVKVEAVEQARIDSLSKPNEFAEQYLGKFVALAGRVFSSFTNENNVIKHIPHMETHETVIGLHYTVPENESAIIVCHMIDNKIYVTQEVFERANLHQFMRNLSKLTAIYPNADIIMNNDNDLMNVFTRYNFNITPTWEISERAQFLEVDSGFATKAIMVSEKCKNLIEGLHRFQRQEPTGDGLDMPSEMKDVKGVSAPKAFAFAAYFLLYNRDYEEFDLTD